MRQLRVDFASGGPQERPPYLIANTIEKRLSQVGLKSAVAARLERREVSQRRNDRLLDQIGRVGCLTRPAR
jgi:hypothetical protein